MAEIPSTGTGETIHDPQDLVEYLRTQFLAASKKEEQMNSNTSSFDNGAFYQRVPIPGAFGHELTRGSTRIVFKPPFSTMVLVQNDTFVEVFAVQVRGEDGHELADSSGVTASQFLVRRFERGSYQPFELITENGVYDADLNEFDPVSGFGTISDESGSAEVKDLEEQIADAMKPLARAHELFDLLSTLNIVATND